MCQWLVFGRGNGIRICCCWPSMLACVCAAFGRAVGRFLWRLQKKSSWGAAGADGLCALCWRTWGSLLYGNKWFRHNMLCTEINTVERSLHWQSLVLNKLQGSQRWNFFLVKAVEQIFIRKKCCVITMKNYLIWEMHILSCMQLTLSSLKCWF